MKPEAMSHAAIPQDTAPPSGGALARFRLRAYGLLLLLLPTLSACAALFAYTRSSDSIKIPHSVHERAKVGCLSCHEEIYDAGSLGPNYRPPEQKCLECHREKKERGECSFCHTEVQKAAPYPRREPTIVMSHASHIERVKEDCSVCHKSLPQISGHGADATRVPGEPPRMQACLSCHEHQADYDAARCQKCHRDLARYQLKPVSAFSHEGNFVKAHARIARGATAGCAQCHEQTFCADCHASTVATKIEIKFPERVGSDFIHRNDFLGRHAVEARLDAAMCQRCHGPSYCQGCHAAQSLSAAATDPRSPHPPGWSIPSSSQFHGTAARRDIAACASCHDQGPNTSCIRCHKVGGSGGNPHPISWLQQHSHDEIHRNSMCLYCHL